MKASLTRRQFLQESLAGNAAGIPLRNVPMTPDVVLKALKEAQC